ncbi:MAG: AAA family ATPase [Magnetospirillum sp.]|nr:AAA family ATPase [Magnetospirillum sp.]
MSQLKPPFLKRITINRDKVAPGEFPFNQLAFLGGGDFTLDLSAAITILVGENGSGKSTLLEALSASAGFPALGGSQHHRPGPAADCSALASALRLSWLPKVSNGFFFRAESFFSLASYMDEVGDVNYSGGRNLHHQSHGESFLALFSHRLDGQQRAIFFMDEPEVALSPTRQLAFLRMLWDWQRGGRVQAIIATHSPIIMSLPGAALLSLDGDQIRPVRPEETEHYRVMRSFLGNPERALQELLSEDEE